MVERPALLLNPWVLRSTETGEQMAQAGEDYRRIVKESGGGIVPVPGMQDSNIGWRSAGASGGDFSDLDYLYDASATLLNLVPDKDGNIKISRKDLGAHAMIHVLAIDPVNTTARTFSLSEQKADFVDLRLRNGLDPKAHFTQQKLVNVLQPGQPFTIADAAASRFEVYDSLSKVYGLYSTLTHDPKLAEFSFILTWPTLKPAEKQALYSKFACHELTFFIAQKDPEFFKTFVKSYLANKKDKTFLDHWLLESNLNEYLEPWKFARLNSVERILLAQRIAGEPAKTSRHLNDLVRLLPPDTERGRMLYETALKANDLAGSGKGKTPFLPALGLKRLEEAPKEMKGEPQASFAPQDPRMPPAPSRPDGRPSAGPRSGGFGGGKREGRMRDKADAADAEMLDDLSKAAKDGKEGECCSMSRIAIPNRLPPGSIARSISLRNWPRTTTTNCRFNRRLATLVPASSFWVDYARHDGKSPFLSKNLADASRNFTEMMFALSVLDLPFTPAKHKVKFQRGT